MKSGKISEAVLKRSVLKKIDKLKPAYTGVGVDAGIFSMDSFGSMAAATAVETGEEAYTAFLAIQKACNSLAAAGGDPKFVTLQVLLPESAEEADLKVIMDEAVRCAELLGLGIVNGHTAVRREINTPVISVTALGAVAGSPAENKYYDLKNAQIVMTKYAGISGAALLARKYGDRLSGRYTKALIEKAASSLENISVIKECKLSNAFAPCEMHDVSEGGVLGAVWELVERINTGCEIDLKKIPIRQETVEITEFFDINPYQLKGDGSLLIVTDKADRLIEKLEKEGIPAAVIGRTTDSNDRILRNEEEVRFLEPNRVEEFENVEK